MKDELLKARVPQSVKDAIARIAKDRGESEAVIIREAIKDYLLQEQFSKISPVDLNKAKPVTYLKHPKRKAG